MKSSSHSIIRNALRSIAGFASLAAGKIWIGSATGVAQEQTMGGEASITAAGAVTVAGTHSGSAHHAAITLATDADEVLGLSGQQITLDAQTANQVFAGPTTGAASDPDFRALVAAD